MQFKSKATIITAIFVSSLVLGGYFWSKSSLHPTGGGSHSHAGGPIPSEAGQSAFAAIAEIVTLLNADPKTDWATIDIAALRKHLVDMNALTLEARAQMQVDGMSVRFNITGNERVVRAAQSMIPAHARELNKSTEWEAEGNATDNGAVLTITAESDATLAKIKALGFFGLMATGAHHQPHHLAMARGQQMNH